MVDYPLVDDPVSACLIDSLAACLCAQLEAVSKPVACCCALPGQQVAWDDCDPGQAWVRVANMYMVGPKFPAPATAEDLGVCGGMGGWAVTVELGVLRCMPGIGEDDELPECEEYTATNRIVLADAHAMRRAILCCDWRSGCGMPSDARVVVGAWTPAGPAGTCVGGTMTAVFEVSACVCDPAPGVG